MRLIKKLILLLGTLAALGGLVWMGQGSGYFPYPESSFMIDQSIWIFRGAMLVVASLVVIIASRFL